MYLLQADNITVLDNLWKWVSAVDKSLFILINNTFTNSFLDSILPVYRESNTWTPVYLFLFILSIVNFKWKAVPWIFFFLLTIGLCDQVSSAFLKEFFSRLRPCRDPEFSNNVRLLLSRCPISGSFTSSHASNHFGMASFIVFTLGHLLQKWKMVFWFWAATIAYGQVYVGVHYPLDVIGGAVVGILIGYATSSVFIRRIGLPEIAGPFPGSAASGKNQLE